jgi:DNA replication ATP-dependent helicase Dna2
VSNKFILVGDLEQLPPIIKNKEARQLGMSVSLFEWLNSKEGSIELVQQYRMNKDIMSLANQITYSGKLECVSSLIAERKIKMNPKFSMPEKVQRIFADSVVFIDTSEIMKLSATTNATENVTSNLTEVEIVFNLCRIFNKYSDCNQASHYGVIAPYNNQVKEVQKKLASYASLRDIEVSTVDQFQGRDKRMIIFSFTNSLLKAEETKELEILNDKRRLTVAITRAKEKLILIGSIHNLTRYKPIASLIAALKERDNILTLTKLDELNLV